MTPAVSPSQNAFAGSWIWLFPAAYVVHIAEELWAPPTFYVWASQFAGVAFTAQLFLVANAVFLTMMIVAVVLVLRGIWAPWLVLALATVVVLNALLHLLGTGLSRSYSPGLFSGLLLYLPLGGVTLVRGVRRLGATAVRQGVVVGVVIHALVPVVGVLLAALLRVGGVTTQGPGDRKASEPGYIHNSPGGRRA
jgi:hypothetical protein